MFLQASVILLTEGGVPQCMLGYHPTPREQTPPLDKAPPWEQTPPRSRHPPGAEHAGRYGQRAGGTHPTGMQSCSRNKIHFCLHFMAESINSIVTVHFPT